MKSVLVSGDMYKEEPGPHIYIKTLSFPYRKFHWRNKKVLRFSYLHSWFLYTSEPPSVHWNRPLPATSWEGRNTQLHHQVDSNNEGVPNSYQPVIHSLHSQSHKSFSYLLINRMIQWAFNCQNLRIALSFFPSRSSAENLKIWGSVRRDARSRQSCLCIWHPLNTTATRR